MEPILTEEDIDQPIEISSEPEVPFNDVDIIVSELEELSKEEKSRIINDQTIELDGDSSIEEHSIKEEIFMESDPEAIDLHKSPRAFIWVIFVDCIETAS